MLNKKLKTIASLISKNDTVIDIGCDHAYLAIYLKNNNLCKEVYASDISENVLNRALENIKRSKNNIIIYLSDGFKNINNDKIDTAIISGMGTSTILNIINSAPKNINKVIISSNNEHEALRKKMYVKKFYIQKEIVIEDNNKFYPIMFFTKEKQKENRLSLKYGKSRNKQYFRYLLTKEKLIIKNIPNNHFLTILKHKRNIKDLNKII